MNKKVKLLLLCLGIVSLLAVFLAAWIYLCAQREFNKLAQKQTDLENQNTYLQKELSSAKESSRNWREKSEAITATLDKISKEYALLQNQYNSFLKEKEALAYENKKLNAELARIKQLYAQAEERAKLESSDKFLTVLLEEKARLEVEIEKLRQSTDLQQAQIKEEKLSQLEQEKEDLENKLKDAQNVSNVLSGGLLQEKKKKLDLELELTKAQERLKNILQERDELSSRLAQMRLALEERLVELDKTKIVLETAVQGVKETPTSKTEPAAIQLLPIVVKAEEEEKAEGTSAKEKGQNLEGRIIAVNEKHRFVVIDIGRDKGVEQGMGFEVYRGKKKVGKIEVMEARRNIAACDIKQMDKLFKIDDTVRR